LKLAAQSIRLPNLLLNRLGLDPSRTFPYREIDLPSRNASFTAVARFTAWAMRRCPPAKVQSSREPVVETRRGRPACLRSHAAALAHRPCCGRGLAWCRWQFGGRGPARHGPSVWMVGRLVCACRAVTEPQGEGGAVQAAKIRSEEGGGLRRNAE